MVQTLPLVGGMVTTAGLSGEWKNTFGDAVVVAVIPQTAARGTTWRMLIGNAI